MDLNGTARIRVEWVVGEHCAQDRDPERRDQAASHVEPNALHAA